MLSVISPRFWRLKVLAWTVFVAASLHYNRPQTAVVGCFCIALNLAASFFFHRLQEQRDGDA